MNRRDFRQLAELRIREAQALLRARQGSGAYYLAGYAVECALKACVARRTRRFEFPDKVRVNKAYTHKLQDLVELVLKEDWERRQKSKAFAANWGLVKDWSEESRYKLWSVPDARELIRAIEDQNEGVLPWLRKHW